MVSDMNLWPQETFTSYVRDVPADAGFLYNKAATLGDKIKVGTKQNTVTYRIPQPSLANQGNVVHPPPQKKLQLTKSRHCGKSGVTRNLLIFING
jgi:hypothetical protein